MDRYRSNDNGATQNKGSNGRSNGITGGKVATPPIGENSRQYGLVDLMDGETRFRRKVEQKRQDKIVPFEGNSKDFEFAHGSDKIRDIRINHKPSKNLGELIHGGDSDKSHFAFSSPTFNSRHKQFEEKKKQGSSFSKHAMLFSYEAPKRAKTEKEKQAEVSRLWNPSAADKRYKPTNTLTNEFKRNARSKGTIFKNDTRLYGSGGYKETKSTLANSHQDITNKKEFRGKLFEGY